MSSEDSKFLLYIDILGFGDLVKRGGAIDNFMLLGFTPIHTRCCGA